MFEGSRGLNSACFCCSASLEAAWRIRLGQAMKFTVKMWSALEKARTGALHLGGEVAVVDTPCLMLNTRKGSPAFITTELLEELNPDAGLLQISPIHFLEMPSSVISEVGGAHSLVGLPGHGLAAFARDSVTFEAHGQGTTKLGAAFETSGGRRLVGPADYMQLVNALKPDFWGSLADEVPGSASEKRNRISVDRTLKWLDHCLSLQIAEGAAFGVVVGGVDVELRKHSAQETAKRSVSGFSLGGLGLGESNEKRVASMEAAIECLPIELPRHISGLGNPGEVLEAVSAGCDLHDSTYPYMLTTGGYAMTFSISMHDDHASEEVPVKECAITGSDSEKINLRSVSYRSDTSPILQNCDCHVCRQYSRAYIHHLLNTREMLAQTLLDIHNVTHYLRFFVAIREAISQSYFGQYKTWFLRQF